MTQSQPGSSLHFDKKTPQTTLQSKQPSPWQGQHAWLLFIIVSTLYCLLKLLEYPLHASVGLGPHFIYLADGWLHGHLYIADPPSGSGDYTFYNRHWYVAFPPLPAILLLPFVAIFHLSHQRLLGNAFSLGMSLLNIGLLLWVLKRFARHHASGLSFAAVAWLLVLFAFGTEVLYVSMQGTVWFQAHVVSTTFLLLHLGELLGKRRPWLSALYLGLASLARTTALLTFPCFLLLTLVSDRAKPVIMWRKLIIFGVILAAFVISMLLYNLLRFGSLLDFGYLNMQVAPNLQPALQTYGQFSPHFVLTNLLYTWLQPPLLQADFPYLTFTPFGTGLFWTTPALLLAFLAFRRRQTRLLAASLLAGCLLPIATLLLYYNTGWYQFGARFSLDFLPFAFLLAALVIHPHPTRLERLLIVLSILLNVWGYLVFAYFPPQAFP